MLLQDVRQASGMRAEKSVLAAECTSPFPLRESEPTGQTQPWFRNWSRVCIVFDGKHFVGSRNSSRNWPRVKAPRPNLITHTDPGDLFVLRNAGNLVPAYGAGSGGEVATIEFAIAGLGVKDIVVCGHSHCGAMKGLLKPDILTEMPAVSEWLRHAESTRRIVRSKYSHLAGDDLLEVTIDENVLVQIENLQTHPAVAAALAQDQLKLHAWVYDIPSGEVFCFDEETEQYLTLGDVRPPAGSEPARIHDIHSGDTRFQDRT
jgi:carbonic anhydrase